MRILYIGSIFIGILTSELGLRVYDDNGIHVLALIVVGELIGVWSFLFLAAKAWWSKRSGID